MPSVGPGTPPYQVRVVMSKTYRVGTQADLVRLAHVRGWIESIAGAEESDDLLPTPYLDARSSGMLPSTTVHTHPSYRLRLPSAIIHGRNLSLFIEDGAYPGGFAHSYMPSTDWQWVSETHVRYDLSSPQTVAQPAEMLGIVSHWGHFFVDALDRLLDREAVARSTHPLLVGDADFFKLKPTLDEHGVVPQVAELMHYLHIPMDFARLTALSKTANYEVNNLLVATLPTIKPAISCEAVREVRRCALQARESVGGSHMSTIFVGRHDVKKRFLIGQSEVSDHLDKVHGAKTIFPENLTVAEAIDQFSGAKRVILPVGSAKFNLAFCRPGTKVLCVTPAGYVAQNGGIVVMMRHLCESLGLELGFFGVETSGSARHLVNSDMRLRAEDADAMVNFLDGMP